MIIISGILINVCLGVIAVLLFGFIIFIHEFGHFFTAKLSGVRVNEFAIGMGPTLFKFHKGETKYALRLFPIGGFCAMEGEDEESQDEKAFGNKPVWKRILIVVMGAVMNIVLGLFLMMLILGQQDVYASTTVSKFADNAPTQAAGLQVGDKIISVNGYRVFCDRDFSFALATDDDFLVDLVVKRNGVKTDLGTIKFGTQITDAGKEILAVDFYVQPISKNAGTLIVQSAKNTLSTLRMVWVSLVGLVSGKYGLNEMAGPVGIVSAVGDAVSVGLQSGFMDALNNILMMMVIITVNLGVVNLLPLPALDGGRLVFLILEGIRRKPVNPKYEGWVHAAGFALLIALMLIITYSDILRLITGQGLGA